MSTNNKELCSKQIISRLVLGSIWLSLPISILLGAPERFTICIIIFTGFILFSHSCLAYIHQDLIIDEKRWHGYFLILIFGPVETERLRKISKTKLVNTTV